MDQKRIKEQLNWSAKSIGFGEVFCCSAIWSGVSGAVCTRFPFGLLCLFSAKHTWLFRKMTEDIAFWLMSVSRKTGNMHIIFSLGNPFVKTVFSPLKEHKVMKYFPTGLMDAFFEKSVPFKGNHRHSTTYERQQLIAIVWNFRSDHHVYVVIGIDSSLAINMEMSRPIHFGTIDWWLSEIKVTTL